jgi:hypothetical protein
VSHLTSPAIQAGQRQRLSEQWGTLGVTFGIMAPVSSLLSRIIGTRHGVSEMTALRRVKVALAGYMVTITFGVVFIAALARCPINRRVSRSARQP